MSFPRYERYKESEVEWLGEVPEHWGITQSRRVFSQRQEKACAADQQLTASQKHGVIYQADFMALEGQKVVQVIYGADILKHVEPNDFVISMRSFQGGIEWCGLRGSTSSAYVMLIPSSKIETKFFRYLFKSKPYIQALQCTTNLVRDGQALRYDNFTQVPLPVVPLPEQLAIAAFLDRETTKIDALTEQQQRLIDLLQEKRQAIISHAVTNGLDPNAPMKASGLEWLGDVPKHWTITPLKWLTDPKRPIMYGIVLPGPDVGEGIPILKGGNVRPSRMNLQSMARTTPEIEAPYARARLKEGDLVYSIRGSIGDCEPVPAELEGSNITQDVARVAIADGACAPWARWALLASSIRDRLASGSLGAAVRGINIFDLKRASIPTPPPGEQAAIAAFIDGETARLERLAAEAKRAIALLLERRSALISAAVTGKIDVRGLVPVEAEAA